MNIAKTIVTEIEDVFSRHAPEIEAGAAGVAAVASNPLVRIMMSAVHVPPSSLERVALLIEQLEADFANAQPSTTPAAPDPAPAPVTIGTSPDVSTGPNVGLPSGASIGQTTDAEQTTW